MPDEFEEIEGKVDVWRPENGQDVPGNSLPVNTATAPDWFSEVTVRGESGQGPSGNPFLPFEASYFLPKPAPSVDSLVLIEHYVCQQSELEEPEDHGIMVLTLDLVAQTHSITIEKDTGYVEEVLSISVVVSGGGIEVQIEHDNLEAIGIIQYLATLVGHGSEDAIKALFLE